MVYKKSIVSIFFACLIINVSYARVGPPKSKIEEIIKISLPAGISTTDPVLVTSVEEANIIEQVYEGLVLYDPKTASPIPGTAKKWKISKDLKTYTFYLRDKLKWSGGRELTASDFVYGWQRMLTKKNGSPWAYMLFNIKNAKAYYEESIKSFKEVGIRAINKKTFVVELVKPQPYFLNWLCHGSMSPYRDAILGLNVSGDAIDTIYPKNGPFLIVSRKPNEKIILKKNPNYWDAKNVKLDEVHFIPIEDENTSIRMYDTGMLDIHGSGTPSDKAEKLLKRKDMFASEYLGTYFYRFNVNKKPFDNKQVRQAFNLAVNKSIITDKIMRSGQKPAYNLIPQGIDGYNPSKGDTFDPKKARDLLNGAGYCVPDRLNVTCKAFPKTEILFNTQGNHKLIAEAIQSMISANLGINNMKLVNMDFKTTRDNEKKGNFFLSRGGWIGDYTDPSTFLDIFKSDSGNNRTGWQSTLYDKDLDSAFTTADLKKRAELYAKAEKILNEEVPILPIYFFVRTFLKKDYVKGYYPNILDKHPLKFVYLSK